MINIAQIIAGISAQFLDSLKVSNQRLFAIIGGIIIALETALLSGAIPGTEKIPVVIVETIVAIAGIFLNGRSFTLATATPVEGQGFGDFVNQQLAVLIEKFKTNSLTSFAVVQSVFVGFKFYISTDETLTWPTLIVNGILSFLMLFTAPKTKPILAKVAESKSKTKW